jgi:4-diphosphocytidyl-2-C-methyl-D-erythritol kinase
MLFDAPAKLNLSFEIVRKRDDGYHDIRSVMQTVFLHDYLWIEKKDEFMYSGPLLCPLDELLVCRAVEALEKKVGKKLPVWVHLDKSIPVGAGMGGGSSDAATTLVALNQLYEIDLLHPGRPVLG